MPSKLVGDGRRRVNLSSRVLFVVDPDRVVDRDGLAVAAHGAGFDRWTGWSVVVGDEAAAAVVDGLAAAADDEILIIAGLGRPVDDRWLRLPTLDLSDVDPAAIDATALSARLKAARP